MDLKSGYQVGIQIRVARLSHPANHWEEAVLKYTQKLTSVILNHREDPVLKYTQKLTSVTGGNEYSNPSVSAAGRKFRENITRSNYSPPVNE